MAISWYVGWGFWFFHKKSAEAKRASLQTQVPYVKHIEKQKNQIGVFVFFGVGPPLDHPSSGSLKYNALKMDKISLIIIEHLALSDILITVFLYIPTLLTLLSEQWVLGHIFKFTISQPLWLNFTADFDYLKRAYTSPRVQVPHCASS